jgi:hypothetical protein
MKALSSLHFQNKPTRKGRGFVEKIPKRMDENDKKAATGHPFDSISVIIAEFSPLCNVFCINFRIKPHTK